MFRKSRSGPVSRGAAVSAVLVNLPRLRDFLQCADVFDEVPKEKREIFTKLNKMSLTQVLLIHISFVALLFLGLRVSSHLVPYLPPWMTNVHDFGDAYTSGADLLVFFGVLLLFVCEKIWLQSGMTESESPQE
jgi:hypothetical protein